MCDGVISGCDGAPSLITPSPCRTSMRKTRHNLRLNMQHRIARTETQGKHHTDTRLTIQHERQDNNKSTAIRITESINFWDITPCSPLSVNRCFGGTYRLHLEGQEISSARTSKQVGGEQNDCHLLASWFL
jgi:hypothetical protein